MRRTFALAVTAAAVTAVLMIPAGASGDRKFQADLSGYDEVPAVSSVASGTFFGELNPEGTALDFVLSYQDLEADATQAHLHFGQKFVAGGVSVFLCSNLTTPPPPPGTAACPVRSGTVTGTLEAADVVGPSGQGIAAGEFGELLRALQSDLVYANVHSTKFPGGEIRGQLK